MSDLQFVGWMYDIAREQSPSEAHLHALCERSLAAGFNAVGLYLEHRYAYPSVPWSAPPGAVTPDMVCSIQRRFTKQGLRIIPFLNTLGHMEGFIRHPEGGWLAEGEDTGGSLQMCATRPECIAFARGLIDDAIDVFDDAWVHVGGDETRQLGRCRLCADVVELIGIHKLYGGFFETICRHVLERGKRPCMWGDMLLQHPDAMKMIPRETVIFDWQYEHRPADSTRAFRDAGFDVVCCPSVQTYNSGWCFLHDTQRNIDEHAEDARALGALGVLATSWEYSFFTNYASTLPVIMAAGRRLRGDTWDSAIRTEGGDAYAEAADILGNKIPAASAFLAAGTWRQLRDRLVMRKNPFELWAAWRKDACGAPGDTVLSLCDDAESRLSEDSPLLFSVELHRDAVRWVRAVENAATHYAEGDLSAAVAALGTGEAALEHLRPFLMSIADSGGAADDVQRLDQLIDRVHAVSDALEALPPTTGERPAFTTLIGVDAL